MRKIIVGGIVIVAILFFYGVYTAKSQLSQGVSLIQIAATIGTMNPVSRYGYQWVMRNDAGVASAVQQMNEAFDKVKAE